MEIPLLQPELIWMLIGERMADGYSMYVDIIDDTAPLSAGVYWLIHLFAGRSLFPYQLLAGALIFFQVAYFNNFLIQYKAFEENTYIPALVMVVLFHFSFDFLTLSPALMGSTFILLTLGQLFSQTARHQKSQESVLLVGLFGGIAACFHFPLVVFLPFVIVAGVVISGFNLPQLLLCLVGYFLPFSLCALYYFWTDGLNNLLYEFVYSTRILDSYHHVTFTDIGVLLASPFTFAFGGFLLGSIFKRLTVNQQKQNQLIVLYLVFSVFSIFTAYRIAPYQLLVTLPGMAFFISQIFIYLKRKKLKVILFNLFILSVSLVGYGWAYYKLESGKMNTYTVNSGIQYDFTKNSKIMVLGHDLGYYRGASLAGPYLNYNLSKQAFLRDTDFKNLAAINHIFANENPEFIIDEEGVFANLLQYLPEIKARYTLEKEGVYHLRQ